VIHIENLAKRYGSFYALQNLNLHVKSGEVFGFLGPNGAGKTTTMKMLVGLVKPTRGNLRVNGIDVVGDPIRARQIVGYIPDRPFLYEKLTAQEFLFFTAGIYGLNVAEQADRAGELLKLFGLSDWANELIESYSHGMKQRLIMAAAVLHRPRLLVVDEPMVGLDPRGALLVKTLFRRMVADGQGTVFMSTHTLEVAEELCDRVAILQKGEVIAMGTIDELRAQAGESGDTRLESLFLRLIGGVDIEQSLEDAGF
jgi:ABC-2 type transport system ATP-binding protein